MPIRPPPRCLELRDRAEHTVDREREEQRDERQQADNAGDRQGGDQGRVISGGTLSLVVVGVAGRGVASLGPPLVEGQTRNGDVVDVLAANLVSLGGLCLDVLCASALEEEGDELVGVVVGVVGVRRLSALLASESAVLFLVLRASEVTGLVVGGDDQQGLVPGGVLLDPLLNSLDGLVEGIGLPYESIVVFFIQASTSDH